MITKSCPTCLNSFRTYQAKYCSKMCYTISQKGKDFLEGNRYTGNPWNKGKKLGMSPNNTRSTKSCSVCLKAFTVKLYRKEVAKYCSPRCSQIARDEGKSLLHQKIRKSAKYKEWRLSVFERDNYTCQICFTRGGELNADHIKPFAYYPDIRTEVSNGRTLCVSCHRETDTFGFKAWRDKPVSQET